MFNLKDFPESPQKIWEHFYNFTQIPRPSGKEEKVREYIISVAQKNGLKSQVDSVGNVIIYVPGRGKNKDGQTVIVQNHMDMVTDKTPDHQHNFDSDPLQVYIENGWVKAKNTTLGSDNGIGCAAALALIEEQGIDHPPLELLFTVDEETGLHGALGLEPQYLTGRKLVNLDTEEWGAAYVGCAGGIDFEFDGHFEQDQNLQANYTLKIGGLKGGHSGIDIHRGRGNAIKLLTQILLNGKGFGLVISSFNGGKAHNIIPRDASANFYLPENMKGDFERYLKKQEQEWREYLNKEDQSFHIEFEKNEANFCLTTVANNHFLNFLSLFPHGAQTYNWASHEPLVNYSNNMAIVRMQEGKLFVKASLRYFDRGEVRVLEQQMWSLGESFGIQVKSGGEYPSWKPDFADPMIDLAKGVYRENFGQELKIKAIHAGLECGILKDKIGSDLQAISFGPTIVGAHSPTESLEVESTNKFWKLLVHFMRAL